MNFLGNYFWNLGTPVFIFYVFITEIYLRNNWRLINCCRKRTLLKERTNEQNWFLELTSLWLAAKKIYWPAKSLASAKASTNGGINSVELSAILTNIYSFVIAISDTFCTLFEVCSFLKYGFYQSHHYKLWTPIM